MPDEKSHMYVASVRTTKTMHDFGLWSLVVIQKTKLNSQKKMVYLYRSTPAYYIRLCTGIKWQHSIRVSTACCHL